MNQLISVLCMCSGLMHGVIRRKVSQGGGALSSMRGCNACYLKSHSFVIVSDGIELLGYYCIWHALKRHDKDLVALCLRQYFANSNEGPGLELEVTSSLPFQ